MIADEDAADRLAPTKEAPVRRLAVLAGLLGIVLGVAVRAVPDEEAPPPHRVLVELFTSQG